MAGQPVSEAVLEMQPVYRSWSDREMGVIPMHSNALPSPAGSVQDAIAWHRYNRLLSALDIISDTRAKLSHSEAPDPRAVCRLVFAHRAGRGHPVR